MKNNSKHTNRKWLDRWYPKILLSSATFALIAAFWQAAERVHMLKNPSGPLSCDINPVVDCGGVMDHQLAALFGFPNTFIGMVMFSMLVMAALLLLFGGSFTKKFHLLVMGLASAALAFSVWFFWVSLYVIGKICLFCLAIWPASIILFWYSLLFWLSKKDKLVGWQKELFDYGMKNHVIVVLSVFLIMIALYIFRFREYYFG